MDDAKQSGPPKRTGGDYVHTIAKAGIAAIPYVGGSAAELFSLVIAPPLEKRKDDWLRELAEAVDEIKRRKPGLTLEDLSKNDAFVSAALQASQIAIRTHQREKREYLRNALIHTVTENSTESEKIFFLALVDLFTITHVEILRLFKNRGSFSTERFRELEKSRDLTDPIVSDLNARGLLNDPRPIAARNRDPMHSLVADQWTLSSLGSRFLGFISG